MFCIVSISLAAKRIEASSRAPHLGDFEENYSLSELKRAEMVFLNHIGWDLGLSTAYDYLEYWLSRLYSVEASSAFRELAALAISRALENPTLAARPGSTLGAGVLLWVEVVLLLPDKKPRVGAGVQDLDLSGICAEMTKEVGQPKFSDILNCLAELDMLLKSSPYILEVEEMLGAIEASRRDGEELSSATILKRAKSSPPRADSPTSVMEHRWGEEAKEKKEDREERSGGETTSRAAMEASAVQLCSPPLKHRVKKFLEESEMSIIIQKGTKRALKRTSEEAGEAVERKRGCYEPGES